MKIVDFGLTRYLWGLDLINLFFVVSLLSYGWQVGQENAGIINWDAIGRALRNYEARPNEENAKHLLALLPDKNTSVELGNREKVHLLLLEDSYEFEKAVISGNQYESEAAFRLYGIVLPGAVLEELEEMLTKLLVKKPRLFLMLLKKYKSRFDYYEYPLFIFGQELVDAPAEQHRQVYRDRIKALKSVKDPELDDIKEECIKLLKKELESIRDW